MMKTICAVFFLAYGAAALKPNPDGFTLRQWMMQGNCLNMASMPLMNTQFAQIGTIDALNAQGLMDKVTGLAGVSSGAFAMALAGTKNLSTNSQNFRRIWPGWTNIVPPEMGEMKDPLLSQLYQERVLDNVLPRSFEELKIPLGVVAVAYEDEPSASMIDINKAEPVVLSDGNLAEAVIVSSSAMIGPGCPRCLTGFSAKPLRGMWPVGDGFLKDEFGTLGLAALEPCPRLLHIMPMNFAQQLSPTKNAALDTSPEEVVSLGLDIPSSGIMSMLWDHFLHPVNNLRGSLAMGQQQLGKFANQDEVWEKIEYETAFDHMTEWLDKPMYYDPKDTDKHWYVDLNLKKHWESIRGTAEKAWDKKFDGQHGVYWDATRGRREGMVAERNERMKKGELSFRACGNGKGAPKCTGDGKRLPAYFNGKKVMYDDKIMGWMGGPGSEQGHPMRIHNPFLAALPGQMQPIG